MTHTSPTTFVVWSVLSTALGAFLLGHLWRFDRFKCLRWSDSPYSGAFKRIMTYTYLITIPLIMIYSFGFTYIKYKEGFIDVGGGIFPKPYTFWSPEYRRAIFPLMMVFSFSWSFEMITHLEELCFWYFLITAGPAQPDWFHSPYFRLWVAGSVGAIIYVPVVTIAYRQNPLSCEARMFTAGSVGDLALTLGFIPILLRFPDFIRKVKAEGVDSSIIVRLRKFYELNVIRIIFRFLMQIPLFALGVDGLKPHNHELNESLFWTDFLSTVAALGCVFSSVCTLLIFFPRSYEAEYQAREASLQRSVHTLSSRRTQEPNPAYSLHDAGEDVEPSFGFSKSATFNANEESDGDLYDNDDDDENMKYEHVERGIGMGLVKERWGSKLRERERKLIKSTKRIGVGLHDALSRRLVHLPLAIPSRKHADPEGSVPLSHSECDGTREVTRRMAPSTRPVRKRSNSSTAHEEGIASLTRKPTYLLTNSPVLRAKKMRERERENLGQGQGASASVETLSAAFAAGVESGYQEMSKMEDGYGYGLGLGVSTESAFGYKEDGKKDIVITSPGGDIVDKFALTPSAPTYLPTAVSAAAMTPAPETSMSNTSPPRTSMPTHVHIHGPRLLKKSSSLSTIATCRRALPTPPTTATGDPLGAAPACYPSENPLSVPEHSHFQSPTQGDDDIWTGTGKSQEMGETIMTIGHPYANSSAYTPYPYNNTTPVDEDTNARVQDVTSPSVLPVQGVTIAPGFDRVRKGATGRRARKARKAHSRSGTDGSTHAGMGVLTIANVSRHNTATARVSQVNPLVRTFTSPIDFLDRVQEDDGANGSWSQIGRAV